MRCLLFALVALAAPASSAPAAPSPGVTRLVAQPDPVVALELRGRVHVARVALGFRPALLLNDGPARAAGLRPFPVVGKRRIRQSAIAGGEAIARGNFVSVSLDGGPPVRLPTVWFDRPVSAGHDAVVSVMALAGQRVEIVQPDAPPGGRTIRLPLRTAQDPRARARVGGRDIDLVLGLDAERTIMNASAARLLEEAGLVRRSAVVGLWRPLPDVRLPWQALDPAPGAAVAGLPLVRPAARVSEAQARAIDDAAEPGTSTADDEPDTILVSARRDGRQRGARPWVLVGRDVLGRCGRILLDRAAREWQLSCAF